LADGLGRTEDSTGGRARFPESVAVSPEASGRIDVLGVDTRPDIGANIADFRLDLILGEAPILCGTDHLVGQGLHSIPVSPRDKLPIGVDAVF
jgi:hypothetical protein